MEDTSGSVIISTPDFSRHFGPYGPSVHCTACGYRFLTLGDFHNHKIHCVPRVSTGSTDSCSPSSPKRSKIDYSLPENCDPSLLIKKFGEVAVDPIFRKYGFDVAPLLAEHGPNYFFQKPKFEEDIDLALEFFKKAKGEDYEYVEMRSVYPLRSRSATHMNFYARQKGSGVVRLFYAEMEHPLFSYKATACSIVRDHGPDQKLLSDYGHIVLHPEGVSCADCEQYDIWGLDCLGGEAFTDSDDE